MRTGGLMRRTGGKRWRPCFDQLRSSQTMWPLTLALTVCPRDTSSRRNNGFNFRRQLDFHATALTAILFPCPYGCLCCDRRIVRSEHVCESTAIAVDVNHIPVTMFGHLDEGPHCHAVRAVESATNIMSRKRKSTIANCPSVNRRNTSITLRATPGRRWSKDLAAQVYWLFSKRWRHCGGKDCSCRLSVDGYVRTGVWN